MDKTHALALKTLALAALLGAAIGATLPAFAEHRKAVITPLEKGYEQMAIKVISGRGGLAAFELVYDDGCTKPCGPATLQLDADSKVTNMGKPYNPREVAKLDGHPGTIYVKVGTTKVTRVAFY